MHALLSLFGEAVFSRIENLVMKAMACLSRLDRHTSPLAITVALETDEMKRELLSFPIVSHLCVK